MSPGETVDRLESEDNQHKLENALKAWLRAKITKIEAARQATQQPAQVS